jgi:hypothetical protein
LLVAVCKTPVIQIERIVKRYGGFISADAVNSQKPV